MRLGPLGSNTIRPTNATPTFSCHPGGRTEATVLFALAGLGMAANLLIMALILSKRRLRRWSQGLIFHQGLVDCARAATLVPLGVSVLYCSPLHKCSILETTFVLLVTVSTINMLTTVLNDSPLIPEQEENPLPLLRDSPQCVFFGVCMIWFAGMTINLGPTFLSGALASNQEIQDLCPLVYEPMRHYILNILWIVINLLCILLTGYHLRKLYIDLSRAPLDAARAASLVTAMVSVACGEAAGSGNGDEPTGGPGVRSYVHRLEREGIERVKMFVVTTIAYVLFWAPLFIITIVDPLAKKYRTIYEVTLHVAFVHAFVNPTLLLVLHRGLRHALLTILCCACDEEIPPSPLPPPPPHAFRDEEDASSPCASYSCTVNRNYLEGLLPPPSPPTKTHWAW